MCSPAQPPSCVAEAVAAITAGLRYLTTEDAADLGVAGQAQCLAALERMESMHTAARARILAAFTANGGYTADGQYGPKPWLRHMTRVTKGAAAGAVGWSRRLREHPAVVDALAAGVISASWAREICGWSDRLPGDKRADADAILLAAATGGAELADLAALAAEMFARSRAADPDLDPCSGHGDGFDDRYVTLETTLDGAGRLAGDVTPACAAALAAVLESLSAKAGSEDVRTPGQRRHDALEEACHRLIASGMLPDRAGQPVQVQVHIPLSALRGTDEAADAEAAWAAAAAAATGTGSDAHPGTCWLAGEDARAAACDATIVPVVTGHADPVALDRMARIFLGDQGRAGDATRRIPARLVDPATSLPENTRWRLNQVLLRLAADVLSGPGGLAAQLRTRLPGQPLTTTSLPLDVGEAGPSVPGHLRRAVAVRASGHCEFPGCTTPATACHVHHLIPRSQGGPTRLSDLGLVCRFHHLVVIHRWGWKLVIHPDGSSTATSPDGRVLHSHPPPSQAA